jgi:hypothetical protein
MTDAESVAMARIAGVVVADFPHHVVQREVSWMDVFFSDSDHEDCLKL